MRGVEAVHINAALKQEGNSGLLCSATHEKGLNSLPSVCFEIKELKVDFAQN